MPVKRILAALLLAACSMQPLAGFTEQEYCTVQALREVTQDGWHQTYETQWHTVQIDVDIDVPDVEAFPIIRVTCPPLLDESTLTNADVIVNRTGDISIQFGADPQEACKDLDAIDFREIRSFSTETPDCMPENNPLSYAEAYAITKQALYDVVGQDLDAQADYQRYPSHKPRLSI